VPKTSCLIHRLMAPLAPRKLYLPRKVEPHETSMNQAALVRVERQAQLTDSRGMGSAKGKSSRLGAKKLALYEQAYRLALASLRGYGWRADDQPRAEAIRTALSESIIEKIVSGETDPKRLRKIALESVFLGERLGKH
jgi:hypothetical protein